MHSIRSAGAILLILAVAVPVQAQKGKKVNAVLDAENALKPGQFTGKILQASETALQLRVDYIHYELNQSKGNPRGNTQNNSQIQQLMRQQQQMAQARQRMMRARSPQEQYRAMQEMQRQQAQMQQQMAQKAMQERLKALQGKGGQGGLFKEVREYRDINIDLDNSVAFRSVFLPSVFDDMGNIKKYTEAEKKELKGDPRLPGYKAAATDLKPGQKVTVTLAKNKETDLKLRGTMVVVTEQSNEPLKDAKKKK